MSYNSNNIGNVLYVSVNGNNDSAKIGDPTRPWRTPQDARDVASNSDWVHVFPGTYTYGKQGSGADYEGAGAGVASQHDDEDVGLNYGKTSINYYLELGVLIQGVDNGPGVPPGLLYEPWLVETETPSTVIIRGYGKFSTPGHLFQCLYKDSDWDLEFDEVLTCARFAVIESNYYSTGGDQEDIPHFGRFRVKANKVFSADPNTIIGTGSSNVIASNGRIGDTRGVLDINIDRIEGSGYIKCQFLYNYDVFIKANHLICSGIQISALKDTVFHLDIDLIESVGVPLGIFEDLSVMTDAELYIRSKLVRQHTDATGSFRGMYINNVYGAGGRVFVHIDSITNPDVVQLSHSASPDSRVTLHGGGFEGETELTFSGNFYEEDSGNAAFNIIGSDIATGASGHMLVKLKDCSLVHIGGGTESIDASNANEDVIIQNVVSNVAVNANVDQIGGTVTVNAGYTH